MCIKEFYGYACGHCSHPNLIICPLTAQDPTFLPCPIQAERSIPALSQYCAGCARALWNKEVLEKENEHRDLHELGQCSFQQCGTAFTEEERKGANSTAIVPHTNIEVMRAVKQAIDKSINEPPKVSSFHGMVVEYTEDDESTPIPEYIPLRQDNGEWFPNTGIAKQSHASQHSHVLGPQEAHNFQGIHSSNGGNHELALQLYQPFHSRQTRGPDHAREFSPRNGHQNYRGNRRRNRNHTNNNRGGFNNFRSGAEFSRYPQQGGHWEQKPKFSGSSQLLNPPNSASRVFQTTTGSYTNPVTFKSPNYAKSSTSQESVPTAPYSPLSTPDRLLSVPPGRFPAYAPERSSYPIPEVLRTSSPRKFMTSETPKMTEEQKLIVQNAHEEAKGRKNAIVELPSEAAISELVVAVEKDLQVSPSNTASYPDTPLDTPFESATPSLLGSPTWNDRFATPEGFVHVDEEEVAQGIHRSHFSLATRTNSAPTVTDSTDEDPH